MIDVADVMSLINYLFIEGSAPDPLEAGDANCDGAVDVADVMYLINYLFVGGSPLGCQISVSGFLLGCPLAPVPIKLGPSF